MSKIVVLGAGVVGLTTALELKLWNPKLDITIVGQFLPGDIDPSYTSPYAGANHHSFASHEDKELQDIDKHAYTKFIQLASNDPVRSGIWTIDNISYFTNYEVTSHKGNFKTMMPWFKDFVKDFKILDTKDIPFDDIAFGTKYKGVVISVPTYLKYLIQQNKEVGNKIEKVKPVENIEQARKLHSSGKQADYVINAAGLNATKIKGVIDKKLSFPVRGQVLVVKNNAKCQLNVEGFPGSPNEMLYMMPRRDGGTIIGGCFLPNVTDTKEDKELTKRIIRRAIKYAPELVDSKFKNNPSDIIVEKVQVGFRPFREDGPRVELDKSKKWLIHNYGAGAGGFQSSYGLARKVVNILKNEIKQSKL